MKYKNLKKQKYISNINPFEEYTEKYEKWFDNNRLAYLSELKGIKSMLAKGRGIEIGVGTGRFAEPLGIEFGIDPSFTMLRIAQKRKIKVIGGVGEYLPIADGSFDFALLVTTFCFLKNTEQTLNEIKRILKKNGYIFLAFIDRESFLGKLYLKKKKQNPFYQFADFYSVKEVIGKLEKAGFLNPQIKQTLFSLPEEIKIIDVKAGYGKGGFIIIKMKKKREV